MAKEPKEKVELAVAGAPDAVQEIPLSLDEYCKRLSLSEKRYGLISGFHHTEKAAGRLHDVASAYKARYDVFLSTPMI